MPAITLKQLVDRIIHNLAPIYGKGEAKALTEEILFRLKGFTPVDIVLKAELPTSEYLQDKISGIVRRLTNHEPIQYIFGVARFYGMDFKVSPSVLIPRPETAELVDIIIHDYKNVSDLRILDLCSGSGAIAIALARNLPFSIVDGIDISPQAIKIATENAIALKTKINFIESDVLQIDPNASKRYEIIVCNPPYIPLSETSQVDINVLKFEPHLALFVPDDNPLLFYHAVSSFARQSLVDNGNLYFEINPGFADRVKKILSDDNFSEIEIIRDSCNRQRFIKALKS